MAKLDRTTAARAARIVLEVSEWRRIQKGDGNVACSEDG
jgi:hypothetical protein